MLDHMMKHLLLLHRLNQTIELLVHGEGIIEVGRESPSNGAKWDESASGML